MYRREAKKDHDASVVVGQPVRSEQFRVGDGEEVVVLRVHVLPVDLDELVAIPAKLFVVQA